RADPDLQLPREPDQRPPHRLQGPPARRRPRRRARPGHRLGGGRRRGRQAGGPRRGRGVNPLRSLVREAVPTLTEAGVASPRADAVALVAHVLGVGRGELERRLVLGGELSEEGGTRFRALVAARAARVPLQHLTGRAAFRGPTLRVGPGVFVPRPETEGVAGLAIEALAGRESPIAVDLCTGSGALALALADEVPGARVLAV